MLNSQIRLSYYYKNFSLSLQANLPPSLRGTKQSSYVDVTCKSLYLIPDPLNVKRSEYYDGYINVSDFGKIKKKLLDLLDVTPNPKGKGSGHSSNEVAKR